MNKNFLKRNVGILLITILILGNTFNIFAAELDAKINLREDIEDTGAYLVKTITDPLYGIVGGDWSVIGLVRSGIKLPDGYTEKYLRNMETAIKEKDGNLTRNKYSEYSRVILALTALGQNPSDVGGYNLLEKLSDLELIEKQGINGPIYALIALDSLDYKVFKSEEAKTQITRDLLVESILTKEVPGGGFSLSGDTADPDVTAAALQALSNYLSKEEAAVAIDRALGFLSKAQTDTGGFSGWATGGAENAESISQAIMAFVSLGIDPAEDDRFIKTDGTGRKHTALDALANFRLKDGSYKHLPSSGSDIMATEQSMLALVSYDRLISKKNPIYDMKDVVDSLQGESYPYKVILNGKYMIFDQPPINVDGRILVPMRAIFEALDSDVDWDPILRKVTGKGQGRTIELTIGNNYAYIDGKSVNLDVPAMIKNGRTLVPLRFISESLNAEVEWDGRTNTAIIEK